MSHTFLIQDDTSSGGTRCGCRCLAPVCSGRFIGERLSATYRLPNHLLLALSPSETMPSTQYQKSSLPRVIDTVGTITWIALYFLTLGFSHKYRERLYFFEPLDPGYVDEKYEPYSEPASYLGAPYRLPSSKSRTQAQLASQSEEGAESDTPQIHFERVRPDISLRARQGVSVLILDQRLVNIT